MSACSYQKEDGEIKKRCLSCKRKDSYVTDTGQNDFRGKQKRYYAISFIQKIQFPTWRKFFKKMPILYMTIH